MTRIGTLVDGTLATVDGAGRISARDGSSLNWWVAADDRWHTPADEPSCRQTFREGTPVVETAIRVPSGDVVHRAYGVVDQRGLVVVEVENQSTLPVAVAFDRSDLLTSRPPTEMAIQGIDLPKGSIVIPIGKGSTVRIALGQGQGTISSGVPAADDVARGWLAVLDRSPRLVLPDDTIRLRMLGNRAEVLLGGLPSTAEPVAYLLAASEAVRCGQASEPLVDDVVTAAIDAAKAARKVVDNATIVALYRASEVLHRADQPMAARDVEQIRRKLGPVTAATTEVSALDGLATERNGELILLGMTVPPSWFGQPLEVHDAPIGKGSVSFAIRWHGERPALLWDASHAHTVRCPGLDPTWVGSGAKGEALLAAP